MATTVTRRAGESDARWMLGGPLPLPSLPERRSLRWRRPYPCAAYRPDPIWPLLALFFLSRRVETPR